MKKPTISDVARLAAVSKATVSAVLNDRESVAEDTRLRVQDAIRELNYRPSPSARRGFRPHQARSLGLIIKEIDNPYYTEVISGAKSYANEHDYTLIVATSEGDYDAERRIVDVLRSKEVDGLIITPILEQDTDLSHLFELKRRNYPFVLLEEIRGVQANLVDVDNAKASQKAIQHLIEQGHTRIVHFAGPAYSQHSQERIDGIRRAYSESHLVFTDEMIVPAGAHLRDGYAAGHAHFREHGSGGATAVTCYNDLVAAGLCRALGELGIRVPEDISVVGFDDLAILEYFSVPLTTVRIPKFEMGRIATEILIREIESQEVRPPEKVYLQAEVVVRGTTRALRADGRGRGAATAGAGGDGAAERRKKGAATRGRR